VDGRFKQAATQCAATIAAYDTKQIFPSLLRQWFASRPDAS